MLARGLTQKGQYAEAEAALQKGIAINPALLEFELAAIYAKHGRIGLARQILARLEAERPTPWSVWSLSQLHVAHKTTTPPSSGWRTARRTRSSRGCA